MLKMKERQMCMFEKKKKKSESTGKKQPEPGLPFLFRNFYEYKFQIQAGNFEKKVFTN